jgi:hypothetical protein
VSLQVSPDQPRLRHASTLDVTLTFHALLKMLGKSPALQMKLAEPEVAYKHLVKAQAEGHLYVYGDYAILVDVGSPWHTSKLVLIEEIIVRFRRPYGHPVDEAIAQLPLIARQHGCVAVAAGDTQIGLMAPRYLAAGFQPLGSQFYKEVP